MDDPGIPDDGCKRKQHDSPQSELEKARMESGSSCGADRSWIRRVVSNTACRYVRSCPTGENGDRRHSGGHPFAHQIRCRCPLWHRGNQLSATLPKKVVALVSASPRLDRVLLQAQAHGG